MDIIYLPLDDRPCNVYYPQWLARLQPQIHFRVPPLSLLGQKKEPAPLDRLWRWLAETLANWPNAIGILSMEMLIYGGLVPSRLHHHSLDTLLGRVEQLRDLKRQYPQFKIYASTLIMRCPTYNSGEEEPDYYQAWGSRLFRWGWLQDQQQRSLLEAQESQEWETLQQQIPAAILQDYCDRRRINLQVNLAVVSLVEEGIIHFLSMPQDDAAPAGFTAMDQRMLAGQIEQKGLGNLIQVYPGADEVGCTLLARAYLESDPDLCPQVYPLYGAAIAETLIPLYEDRPLRDSVSAHLRAAGAQVTANAAEADLILALNTPGLIMQEAWEQTTKDASYQTHRNLGDFIDRLQHYLDQGQAVALADIAFANGGETECIEKLDHAQLLDRLLAYGGWNTCGNTLGTVIATAILGWRSSQREAIAFNLLSRLWEDWLYQAIVRQHLIAHYLPSIGASYYDFAQQDQAIAQETERCLQQAWQAHCPHSFPDVAIKTIAIEQPWHRMFEIYLNLTIESACKP